MSGRGETFLGRWARRKLADPELRQREDRRIDDERADAEPAVATSAAEGAPPPPPADLPLLESLTPEADFSRFMKADVPLPARNAALRKLFSDPHFNVMDGLDTYIDDYTRPDPIPAAMLRELAQSRMLRLFDEDAEADAAVGEAAAAAPAARADAPADGPAALPTAGDAPDETSPASGGAHDARVAATASRVPVRMGGAGTIQDRSPAPDDKS